MIVCRYRFSPTHTQAARLLLKSRQMKEHLVEDIPEITFIAFEDMDEMNPIAMGSMRLMEGHFGYLDGFITDPKYSSQTRHDALTEITKTIIEEAQSCHLNKVIALSEEDSLMLRGYHEGFGYVPQKVMILNLGGN